MSPAARSSSPGGRSSRSTRVKGGPADPGRLIDVAWLADHLRDPDLRLVHVSPDRRVYNKRHLPGATYSELHKELALKGTAPETGDAAREWLVPTPDQAEALLRRWRVGEGDRIVLYDDVGQNRQAIRGYWLLRLYRYPPERLHILDGGLDAWRRAEGPTTTELPEADLADGMRVPVQLEERDDRLVATYEEVLAWSEESTRSEDGPTRILDVRTAGEYVGSDLRARRGGHIPGARQRLFSDFLTDEGTFRSVDEIVALVRAGGAEPGELRATYCQGGVRAALAWFALHELAGFDEVRSYAGSWEEWGNRDDSPIERP